MKAKYTSIVGILAMLVLIASFVVPAKLTNPEPVSAQQPPMEWLPVDTPDTEPGILKALYSPVPLAGGAFGPAGPELGSEITKLLIGNDGTTMYTRVTRGDTGNVTSPLRMLKSVDGGIIWSVAAYNNLDNFVTPLVAADVRVWDIAIAPDNPSIIAAAISVGAGGMAAAQQVWISTNGGTSWENTLWNLAGGVAAGMFISCMDISTDYGNARDILVGVRSGADSTNIIYTMKMPGYGGWNRQDAAGAPASTNPFTGDVIDAKFSPTYIGDSTIIVLFSTAGTGPVLAAGTYLLTGAHDIITNATAWQPENVAVEISPTAGASPTLAQIITGMIQLPSDYSGQSASLRRVYISTDAISIAVGQPDPGVFRVDDNVVYTLMDNSITSPALAGGTSRRAASIAYWGTYASGKLLVGERLGSACTAAVDTWFTDSPTTCPVPCWYPAKKPVSGAAGQINCVANTQGYGNAYVVWSPTYAAQGVAYAVTGSSSYDAGWAAAPGVGINWPWALLNAVSLDESAFSLTRNNGETWNQLSLIDTRINKLTDVAPSADCTTVYLASVNNAQACKGFDSVWRSSVNEKVVAPPLPALPIGSIWERVRVAPTARTCNVAHANYAILRLAPDKLDGQVVGWAAGGSNGKTFVHNNNAVGGGNFLTGPNTNVMAWSPDFGDYWANINPRLAVNDFAFESSTILYVLEAGSGNVQKMPYTGTAWSSAMPSVSTNLGGGHTIEAKAPDKVLVGNQGTGLIAPGVLSAAATPFPVAISTDGGVTFIPMVRVIPQGAQIGYHAIFDTDYGVGNNTTVYEGSDAAGAGLIHRNNAPSGANVPWTDMITGFTTHVEYYGLVQTNSQNVAGQGTLYAAHAGNVTTPGLLTAWSGVERTLSPLDGIPKPGIEWCCLDADGIYRPNNPQFTLEPKSLKLCGCLTQDTNATLYAIDDDVYGSNHNGIYNVTYGYGAGVWLAPPLSGRLWAYEDCMAKKGPVLTMDDGAIIGCDPATGRAQEVNFTWEQLCIANTYQLQIAKDSAFTLSVYDSGAVWVPSDVTSPALIYYSNEATAPLGFIPLECGHTYYWKVRVVDETTADAVVSPSSEIRSFTIKAGFRVTTPYYGPQLLEPDNGCGCACDAPICFSWSPFKETTEYMFELSENADMSSPLVSTTVPTTAYQYTGTVECNKNYFWRVMAVQPAPSEWSAIFSFMTQPEIPAPEPTKTEEPGVPLWGWTLIAIGTILIILLLVLIVKTRRKLL